MLTLLLVAIVMSILYGILFSTLEAQQRVEEVTYASEIGPTLLAQIRRDLEAAILPGGEQECFVGVDRPLGLASRDRVDFVSSVLSYGTEDPYGEPVFHSVNEAGYQLIERPEDPSAGMLCRREDFFIDEDPLKGGRLVELYHRVKSFDVTYYDGKEWQKSWASKERENKLPVAIRVELVILVPERGQEVERTYTMIVTRL